MQIIHMKCLSKKITSNLMKLFVWVHKAFTVTEQNIETNEAHICREARSLMIKFTNNSFLSGLAALSNISNI